VKALPVDLAARADRDDMVDHPLDRPVFEQAEIDADDEQDQAETNRAAAVE
jgi:hypothetical protein